jgi:hypothetical protein
VSVQACACVGALQERAWRQGPLHPLCCGIVAACRPGVRMCMVCVHPLAARSCPCVALGL